MIQPAQYALYNNFCKNNVSSIINEFAKELKNISGKYMDIGSGPGDVTKDILLPALDPSATMIGIDICEKMVEFANKTYGDEKLKFEVLDIQTKNLPEKYISEFDHIFSFNALQWCHDIRQTFENIYCMLRPGKTVLISSISHSPLFECLESMTQDVRFASYMEDKKKYVGTFHYSIRPDKELKELLENIGFQVHHCSHREMNNFFNIDQFISMVTSQYSFKFLEKMPHNLREEFKNELKRKLTEIRIKQYSGRQGDYRLYNEKNKTDIPISYTTLVVYAQKNVS